MTPELEHITPTTSIQNPISANSSHSSNSTCYDEIGSLYMENINLKKNLENTQKERDKYKDNYSKLADAFANQGIELNEIKQELKETKKQLEDFQTVDSTKRYNTFQYSFTAADYGDEAPLSKIRAFWDNLLILCDQNNKNDYTIPYGIYVIAVYKVVTESKEFKKHNIHYHGTFKGFIESWNNNVAQRIKDEERRESLTVKSETMIAEKNKKPWKNIDCSSWYSMCNNNEAKHKSKLKVAYNIKVFLEDLVA